MIRWLFLFFLTWTLHAQTPEIYSAIGDPVYQALEPTREYTTFKTFRNDRKLFSDFVKQADKAKKEGFWLDKNRHRPEIRSRTSAYLERIRRLAKTSHFISEIVKKETLEAIRKNHKKTYAAIRNANHPVFNNDRELKNACARFERKLRREKEAQKRKKAQRHAAYLRSFGNLKGSWHGTEPDGTKVTWNFIGKNSLDIVSRDEEMTLTIRGTWTIAEDLLTVRTEKITQQKEHYPDRSRESTVTMDYDLNGISEKSLKLYDTRRQIAFTLKKR